MALFDFLKTKKPLAGEITPASEPKPLAASATDGYEAAAFSRNRSTLWTTSPELSANPSPYTRGELLRNARYLVKNLAVLERALSAVEANAVGGGLFASATTEDKEFNTVATKTFDKWAHSVFCTADNEFNLFDIQKLISRELVIAGEVFIVMQKAETGYPQITLVNSERVRHSGRKEDTSIDGLWVSDFGKVEFYNVSFGKAFQKIPASSVIHLKRAKEIGALRGICSFAASQNSCRDILDSIGIEKLALKAHSMIALALEKDGGEAPTGILGAGIGIDGGGSATTERTNRRLENPFGGAGIVLNKGESLKLLTGERTTEGFTRFIEVLTREICLNLNLSYDYLISPAALNGVGVRFVIADCDATFRDLQDRIIDGAMMRLYGWVLALFIKDGKLPAPANGLPWDVNFIRPLRLTVDNGRNSSSDIALVQNGMMTLAEYFSQRGKLWTEEVTQRAHEEAFLNSLSAEYGIPVARLRTLAAGTPAIPDATPTEDHKQKAA
jgi:capsid protein